MSASLTIKAQDAKTGMSLVELATVLEEAKSSGFTIMGRTRVGFKGQILEINFRRPDNEPVLPPHP